MKLTRILLIAIIILAAILRLYKLSDIPPAITWDEAAVGVNAWTIANFGRDEYGKFLPPYFRSFGENKHPVLIYVTALSVKFLGLNEFSTRFPSAIFGTLNVLLIFFLGKLLFKSNLVGFFAALYLAISPYNIHFSRFNHEANFALFFFMLGLILFYLSFKRNYLLSLSVLSFSICFITYLPSKVVAPIMVGTLAILYLGKIIKNKVGLLVSSLVIIVFLLLIMSNPELLGTVRAKQTFLGKDAVEKTKLFQLTHDELLGRINLTAIQYFWHFSPQYLFIQGDKNARLSSQTGEFYKLDVIFLIMGVFYLIYKRSKESVVLLTWVLVAPLPSSLVADAPHAARAMFMMGSWHLVSALGIYTLIGFIRKPILKIGLIIILLVILTVSLFYYLRYYFGEYTTRYAIEWQYGMKQIVEFVKEHKEYNQIFMTDIRHQPYIFFLFYLKTPLPEYLNTVVFNRLEESKDYNLVSYFDKYFFGGWDTVESMPNLNVLYVVSPSEYDGLKHKNEFNVKKLVQYPNGTAAFYLVGKD